ncbi:MAG TPA: DUF1360 domain-containing protein [Labilithrix sp.]|nr:DUF1360 domain-containing protein [Labilithrix sp.]
MARSRRHDPGAPFASIRPMDGEASPRFRRLLERYAGEEAGDVPLAAYATLILVFSSVAGFMLAFGSRRGALPAQISARDIALLGIATQRLSRIVTRDKIATPLRAPFTQYEGAGGAGEVRERPRGEGFQKALGSLLTCQFCAAPWITLAFATALIARPRETRIVASGLAVVTVSDFLHQLYALVRRPTQARRTLPAEEVASPA